MTTQPSKSGKLLDSDTWDAMKAVGFSEQELQAEQPAGPIIFSYTRADAIEDGVLVDLMSSPETASVVKEAGFRLHTAMTATAFGQCIGYGELPAGQSISGRLWDVLMVLRAMIRRLPDGEDRCYFKVSVWDGVSAGEVALWALVGPGDSGEPVLTIMLEGED